jgi:hypothetical protein
LLQEDVQGVQDVQNKHIFFLNIFFKSEDCSLVLVEALPAEEVFFHYCYQAVHGQGNDGQGDQNGKDLNGSKLVTSFDEQEA